MPEERRETPTAEGTMSGGFRKIGKIRTVIGKGKMRRQSVRRQPNP